ncbi:hypothetical protein QBC34DRAFT_389806 [Podospora aff. communis PSN243]|uniref:Uncharacterized protein n=1 Tax=Podospora aff. communis PSN243 TaxID=3040156 RepID=A0AAV9H2V4_9PEZI|nr:hypothetical protein QBC34DRAFT_389806 [Podospora aff. communis PSN243]
MSKTVKFRRDSPSGKSYLDNCRSDSGVGSMSSDGDRDESAYRGDFQHSLHCLLEAETIRAQQWMDKAKNLEALLMGADRDLKETQMRLRELEAHTEELDEEQQKLVKANSILTEKNARLEEDLRQFKSESKRSSRRERQATSIVSGSGAEDKKPRQSREKRYAVSDTGGGVHERLAIERERERITKEKETERKKNEEREKEKAMERLRKRFAKPCDAITSKENSSSTSARSAMSGATLVTKSDCGRSRPSHRREYVEPLAIRMHPEKQPESKPSQKISRGKVRQSPQVQVSYGDEETSRLPNQAQVSYQVQVSYEIEKESEENDPAPKIDSEHTMPNSSDVTGKVAAVEGSVGAAPEGTNATKTLEVLDAPATDEVDNAASLSRARNAVEASAEDRRPCTPDSDDAPDIAAPRVPSPWQEIGSGDFERSVAVSAWQMINRLGHEVRRLESETSSLGSSGSADGIIVEPSRNNSGSDSAPSDGDLWPSGYQSFPVGNQRSGSKRPRNRSDQAGDSDNEDERPSGKRTNISALDERLTRSRFACPYQKYDPLGSPFCCMPSTKNPEGGADTFARIKSHIFRNHDPLTRCPNCWKACKTEDEAAGHRAASQCIKKASPSKYWMTGGQRHQVRGQKFVANSVDNWFCLFEILLPDACPDVASFRRRYSPYYFQDRTVRPLPASSIGTPSTSSAELSTTASAAVQAGVSANLPQLPGTQPPSFSPQAAVPNPNTATAETFDFQIPFSTLFPDLANDMSIDDISSQDSIQPLDIITYPPLIAAPAPIRTPSELRQIPSPPPSTSRSTSSLDHGQHVDISSPTHPFLLRDNERLRADNATLQYEVDMLRRRQGRMQSRLDELWNEVRPLDRILQELLYLPAAKGSESERVVNVNHLFGILERIGGVKKALNSCQ